MKKFIIDYSFFRSGRGVGSVIIEAESQEEAEEKFANGDYENEVETITKTIDYDDDINSIEEYIEIGDKS